jgi:hypothetical protein
VYSKKLALINLNTNFLELVYFWCFYYGWIAHKKCYVWMYFDLFSVHLQKKNEEYKCFRWKWQKTLQFFQKLLLTLFLSTSPRNVQNKFNELFSIRTLALTNFPTFKTELKRKPVFWPNSIFYRELLSISVSNLKFYLIQLRTRTI